MKRGISPELFTATVEIQMKKGDYTLYHLPTCRQFYPKQTTMHPATPVQPEDILTQLSTIRDMKSFGPAMYPVIDQMVESVASLKKNGILTQEQLVRIQHFFGRGFLENTLHGMALLKPYGYAGDFLMIDRIYTGNSPADPFYRSWDGYFQNHAAPKAVRNRKTYFKEWVQAQLRHRTNLRLLNIASGPGRDLLELYEALPSTASLQTTCVEMDPQAIEYARRLLTDFSGQLQFIQRNIFRFTTEEKYDLLWSAGLFDYFDDKAFVAVLKKCREWVLPGGEIVIGNFNRLHNPTRNYMELFGEWYLHHRSQEELMALAGEAGFLPEQIRLGAEPEQVNLFLHLRKP